MPPASMPFFVSTGRQASRYEASGHQRRNPAGGAFVSSGVRVPISKVYRAFPELDPFDDEQCELFVHQATSGSLRRRAVGLGYKLLALVVGLATWAFVFAMAAAMLSALRLPQTLIDVLGVLGAAGFVFVPALAALVARDQWLRRTVKARLVSARCPGCEYSLLGLPVQDGRVACPECGEQLHLERMGLTPRDLIAAAVPV